MICREDIDFSLPFYTSWTSVHTDLPELSWINLSHWLISVWNVSLQEQYLQSRWTEIQGQISSTKESNHNAFMGSDCAIFTHTSPGTRRLPISGWRNERKTSKTLINLYFSCVLVPWKGRLERRVEHCFLVDKQKDICMLDRAFSRLRSHKACLASCELFYKQGYHSYKHIQHENYENGQFLENNNSFQHTALAKICIVHSKRVWALWIAIGHQANKAFLSGLHPTQSSFMRGQEADITQIDRTMLAPDWMIRVIRICKQSELVLLDTVDAAYRDHVI